MDKFQSLDRHFDARIRGLSRQNHGQRDEIPRQRTRKGQPRCFNCGRTGHPAINGSERKEASPQPLPQKSYPARRSYYQPHFSYNQPRDGYQNSPQQHRRDLNLAVLDEHLSNEDFIAEPERNTTSQVSTDSQEPFHKKGKIMQVASVNIIASETVMSSKLKSRNSQTSHRRLTPRCLLPLPGKINQTFQYVKPTAERETRPYLGHVPEPARTQENNVEKIREEIKSNLASALNLFKKLPSVHKTTVRPGNQPNEAQSPRAVVPHGTTPRLIRSPIESPTLSVHNRDKVLLFSAKLLNRFQVV